MKSSGGAQRRLTLPACLTLLLPTICVAQDDREAVLGVVYDRDGDPWPDAEVRLLHRAHPEVLDPERCDELTLRTDDHGRFRGLVLPGTRYLAWAQGPLEADNSRRTSDLAVDVIANMVVTLREGQPSFARRFRPELDASWEGQPMLRWYESVTMDHCGLGRWLTPDDDGVMETSAWPTRSVRLEAWLGDCRVHRSWLRIQPSAGEDESALMHEVAAVQVPPRRTRTMGLVDATGASIAGAEVRQADPPPGIAPLRSDAKGRVVLVFADDREDRPNLPYGYRVLPSSEHAEIPLSPVGWSGDSGAITARRCDAGRTVRGRLLWSDGTPADSMPLIVDASSGGTGGWSSGRIQRLFRTAADGCFAIPGRSQAYPFRLSTILTPADRARFRSPSSSAVAPVAILAFESDEAPADLKPRVLDDLILLDIVVRRADGAPPDGPASVQLSRPLNEGQRHPPANAAVVNTDRRGRVRVLVPSTAGVLVQVITEEGAAHVLLEADQRSVELVIDPRCLVRMRIVDDSGTALPNVYVRLLRVTDESVDDKVLVAAASKNVEWHPYLRVSTKSDENGLAQFVAPLLGVRLELDVSSRDRPSVRTVVSCPAGDDPTEVVFR